VQLVIPLEIDQCGEDVKVWDIFHLFLWWVIRHFVFFVLSVYSS
jgi:hypothetical protein